MSYFPSPATSTSIPSGNSFSSYQCPSILSKDGSLKSSKILEDELKSWIRDAKAEGISYLKSCRAYTDLSTAIDIIAGKVNSDLDTKNLPKTLSKIYVPSIKRDVKEMVAILSNIRPSWIYETRNIKDETWAKQAKIQNGLSKDWYERNFVDRDIKKLLQLGTVEGTGYLSPIWNPHLYGIGKGGIELKTYRYDEVLPVQIPKDFNLQNAYANILVDEMGINRARKTFPHKAHLLVPDRGQSKLGVGWIETAATTFMEAITGADNPSHQKTSSGPVVDILYIYVDDFTINPTQHSIQMGASSWGYEVPYVGQQLNDGYNKDGSIKTRKAQYEDCYLYPNKRLIIASNTAILYDGPSYWWHGKTPIIKYSPDEWIFSFLGFSMAAEVLSLEHSANKMRRGIEDALHLKLDPPVAVDEIGISKTVAKSTSLRFPGRRIRGKLQMGEFMKPIMNPQFYDIRDSHFAYVNEVEDKISHILGLPDLKALQQASQIPSSDSIEKFFSEAGAIVTDMSRSLDPVVYDLADMNRYYFYQFYTLEDRIKIMGSDGITEEDFDFNPGTLIPQSLPNEPLDEKGIYLSSELERAKKHINNFKTSIEPTSLHQITHMQKKLLYMQASKVNPLLVDVETLAKVLDIANWGHLEGETVLAKKLSELQLQQQFGLKAQFDQGLVQLLIQAIAQSQSPEAQMGGALGQLAEALKNSVGNNGGVGGVGAGGTGGGANPFGNPVGRPPSFESAPQLQNRPGERTVLSTSGS